MKRIIYAGIILLSISFSTMEIRADNPFIHFKPYEQENPEPEQDVPSSPEENPESHLE